MTYNTLLFVITAANIDLFILSNKVRLMSPAIKGGLNIL
jgi:hypothetical protein